MRFFLWPRNMVNVVIWNKAVCRGKPPTLQNINCEVGFSGTETAATEAAGGLAAMGCRVFLVCHINQTIVQDGITYTPIVPVDERIDVFVPMFFIEHQEVLRTLSKLSSDTLVVVWLQCILRPHMWLHALPMLHPSMTVVVGPSNFALQHIPAQLYQRYVVPNAINPIIYPFIDDLEHQRRKGNWVFHACWERGGHVAFRVFERYEHKRRFYVAGYAQNDAPNIPEVRVMGSLSKRALREVLCKCDYFVYPLVLPSGSVHHDTYACVCQEAMAAGAIVVTWKVACLPECFSDCAEFVDPPAYRNGGPTSPFGFSTEMNSKAAADLLLQAVRRLDRDPVRKEQLRQKAARWAASRTWQQSTQTLHRILMTHINADA
jgi:hypothetical protein